MKRTEKRNEFVIHGVFVLAVMILCLVSTVTFALAADGDGTPAELDTTSNTESHAAPDPQEILAYLDANPDIPPEVREQILQSVNNPEELASVIGGLNEQVEVADNSLIDIPLPMPVVDPAAFTLPADATAEQHADFQLWQNAIAEGDGAALDNLMEKYGHGEGGDIDRSDMPWFEGMDKQDFEKFEENFEGWKEEYDKWETTTGGHDQNYEGTGEFQTPYDGIPEQWQGQQDQDWTGNQFDGSGDHEMPLPSGDDYFHEYSSGPEQNGYEGNQEMHEEYQPPEQYQQEQQQQEYQPPEGHEYQPPQP